MDDRGRGTDVREDGDEETGAMKSKGRKVDIEYKEAGERDTEKKKKSSEVDTLHTREQGSENKDRTDMTGLCTQKTVFQK